MQIKTGDRIAELSVYGADSEEERCEWADAERLSQHHFLIVPLHYFRSIPSNEEMDHKNVRVYFVPLHHIHRSNLFTLKQTKENEAL